ncbi:MAG: proline--tRNA ligase [Eubacterium sp.]|nr:proline--tRNA ligase [Eubacterium sp.]
MKLDKLVGERFKERPSECAVESHAFMVRGGYMKNMANGIFSQYPPLKRITTKIENIIRKEMDAIDGQEVLFPVALPASLWEESGRYESVGSELLRFEDRNKSPMVLGMTHEEAAVHLVREYGNSYTKYPFMIYQIQTKFRDEARPRAGMIRVREFTMKDAYSFHTSMEDLEEYYDKCYKAYQRIFARAGIPEVVVVASDSGMMGGSISHEYMLLADAGEDSIVICDECDYSANMEAAKNIIENEAGPSAEDLKKVETGDNHTIEEVCEFLGYPVERACKAVVYQKNEDDSYVVLFTRGDMEANETKITNVVGAIHPAVIEDDSVLVAGCIGPYGISDKVTVLYDSSLKGIENLCCGANEADKHYTGLNIPRDLGEVEFGDYSKAVEGGICPKCGKHSLGIARGIEVGNIFQLGTKYTKSMGMEYLDAEGKAQNPIMGCYGIGVGRLAASVCEVKHDDYGPIWPITIAPWEVHLCCMRADDEECKAFADDLYDKLQKDGLEVIYDDRNVRAGAMFSDADLIGVPVRVVVSPRNMKNACIELSTRDKSVQEQVPLDEAVDTIKKLVAKLYADIEDGVKEYE